MSRFVAPPPFRGPALPVHDARHLVIKVKYGDTLKRFNASVKGSQFDHNLATLRSKIANAFKFSPSDEFVLTYTDEDGDVVMLDDDDDLRDAAISQKLNPLRIDVQLNPLRIDVQLNSSSAGAKQQASDTISPKTREAQLAYLKSAVDEALYSVPDQRPAVLAKIAHELSSKAASSVPPLAKLPDQIAKLTTSRSSVQPTSGLTDSSSGPSSGHLQHLRNLLTNDHPSQFVSLSGPQSSDLQSSKSLGLKSVPAEETKSQVGQAPGYTSTENPSVLGSSGGKLIYPRKKRTDAQSKGKSLAQIREKYLIPSSVPPVPYAYGVPTLGSATEYEQNMYMPFGSYGKTNGDSRSGALPRGPLYGPATTPGFNGMMSSGFQATSVTNPGWSGNVNRDLQAPHRPAYDHNPFKPSMVHPYGFYEDTNSLGSYGFANSAYGSLPQPTAHTVHKWIECDGCGMTPVVGPRYKSIVKDDYDLCSSCFSLVSNEAEYTRIDVPMCPSGRLRNIDKNLRPQLDCCFIKDLTVPDGTVMAPSTPFRKIWCMRNSGSTAWPSGTQLTWIGGDQFARQSSVKLGISEFGFPVGGEIDVCVDFVAPAKPGRYISHWRLASPDLLKFGQRVWVFIQVEQPVQTSGKNDTAEINLNLPTDGNPTTAKPFMAEQPVKNSGSNQTVGINLNLPAEGITATWPNSSDSDHDDDEKIAYSDAIRTLTSHQSKGSKAVASVMPCAPKVVEYVEVPITDPTSSAGAVEIHAFVPVSETAPLPEPISVSAPSPAATLVNPCDTPVSDATVSVPAAPSPDEIFTDMEEKLLRELADMGFRQADLNKEVLRQNEYDLQKSVDDLCGFHEWDPLLAELKELGFNDDAEIIKELLAKDDEGSIMKRVVMNLRSRGKDQ